MNPIYRCGCCGEISDVFLTSDIEHRRVLVFCLACFESSVYHVSPFVSLMFPEVPSAAARRRP